MLVFGKDTRRWPTTGIFEDGQGRFTYYPFGGLGRGRILPGPEAADSIEKKIAIATAIDGCAIAVLIGAVIAFDASFFLMLPSILIGLICIYLYIHILVRSLPVTEAPFDRRAWQQRESSSDSRQNLALRMLFFGAMFVFFFLDGPGGHPWFHAFVLLSTAAAFTLSGWRLLTEQFRA